MTRAEFMKYTGLSRGQMDRAIAKAKAAPGGRVELPQVRCVLTVSKAGEGTFDAVDLQLHHEVSSDQEPVPVKPSGSFPTAQELASMPKQELERYKLQAEILKIRLATGEAEAKIHQEALDKITESMITVLSDVRVGLVRLKLPDTALSQIRGLIDAALEALDA